ncbi:hypothetical protein ElyMa_004652800, partial [Elysia marginata]
AYSQSLTSWLTSQVKKRLKKAGVKKHRCFTPFYLGCKLLREFSTSKYSSSQTFALNINSARLPSTSRPLPELVSVLCLLYLLHCRREVKVLNNGFLGEIVPEQNAEVLSLSLAHAILISQQHRRICSKGVIVMISLIQLKSSFDFLKRA